MSGPKDVGSVRASKWANDIYTENGVRKEYRDLSPEHKKVVQAKQKEVSKTVWNEMKDKKVVLQTDKDTITVQFTRDGVDHFTRDAMLLLSGKYFSEQSLKHIDEILAKSTYVSQGLTKNRKDGKDLFFRYEDSTGRGVYFKVAREPRAGNGKTHYLYSIVDI